MWEPSLVGQVTAHLGKKNPSSIRKVSHTVVVSTPSFFRQWKRDTHALPSHTVLGAVMYPGDMPSQIRLLLERLVALIANELLLAALMHACDVLSVISLAPK